MTYNTICYNDSYHFKTPQEAAYTAALLGFPVFPCYPKSKTPMLRGWQQIATTDLDTIQYWWHLWPAAMIGVLTGKHSGYFVLDIDVKDGVPAEEKLQALESAYGKMDYVMKVRTPSGGIHLYIPMPEGIDLRNSSGKLGKGIDIRANGGLVIFPGSIRADGKRYTLVREEVNHD